MSLLQAYLQKPSTQRILSRKPGEKGFSLIELVVVVAVLAILAAIAVPAFMGMGEQAANSAAVTNLKNAYKECAYQIARAQASPVFTAMTDDAYFQYTGPAGNSCNTAPGTLSAQTTANHTTPSRTITIDLTTGAKSNTGGVPQGITW